MNIPKIPTEYRDKTIFSAPKFGEPGPNVVIDFSRGEQNSTWNRTILCLIRRGQHSVSPDDLYTFAEDPASHGFMTVGIASCSKEDTFDLKKGYLIAFDRALQAGIKNKQVRQRLWKHVLEVFEYDDEIGRIKQNG